MSGDDSEEKTRPASDRKLQKLRKEGQVAQTSKMANLVVTAVALGALLILAPGMVETYRTYFDASFQNFADPLRPQVSDRLGALFDFVFWMILPVAAAASVGAILLVVLFHKGIPFSVVPLRPDFNRLNPAQGFKRIFEARNAIEFGIALFDIVFWFGLATLILYWLVPPILAMHACGTVCLGPVAITLITRLAYAAIAFCVLQVGLELLLQKVIYLREQRMTETEHKREMKDEYGSPEVRSERNRLRREAASEADGRREHGGVEKANMCFFTADAAVAIRYHRKHAPLPRVSAVAQGSEAALALRKAVRDNGFRELENAKITGACLKIAPGMPVPEAIFEELALGMSALSE